MDGDAFEAEYPILLIYHRYGTPDYFPHCTVEDAVDAAQVMSDGDDAVPIEIRDRTGHVHVDRQTLWDRIDFRPFGV